MGLTEWLDTLADNWLGQLIGVAIGVGLQLLLAIFMVLVGLPVDSTVTFVLAELSVLLAGFVAAWMGKQAMVANGIATAIICAFVSLIASTFANPAGTNLLGVLVLFGSYCLMGGLGGFAAGGLRRQREQFEEW